MWITLFRSVLWGELSVVISKGRGDGAVARPRDPIGCAGARFRSANGANYDCVVPVSGGKDSTTQTLRMLELGMNPLCVTATTDQLSDIGRRNIENLKRRLRAEGHRFLTRGKHVFVQGVSD